MRARIFLAAGLVLAGLLSPPPTLADVSWTGPGWYVEATETGLDTELISGPYPDEATCNAHKPADDDNYAYACLYEQSD